MYIVTHFQLIDAHEKKRMRVKNALQESENCLIDSPVTKKLVLCMYLFIHSFVFKLYKTETLFNFLILEAGVNIRTFLPDQNND